MREGGGGGTPPGEPAQGAHVNTLAHIVALHTAVRVEQHVEVRSQEVRKIVVGKQGASIDAVVKAARAALERQWQRPVHLVVGVRVAK